MGTPGAAPEPLPSELNTSSCSLAFLEIGKDKLSVRYNGLAQHDNDVGSMQANHPAPRRRLVYYFEITVKEASGGSISIGFSDRNFKQGRHPGYEPGSYGYRGDTGRKHHSSLPVRGEEYGPVFGPGDIVGAGIHLPKHEIFFTKNGQHLGTAFRNVSGHPLFPTIGLHSQGARVEVNFGRQPFQYNVGALMQAEQRQMDQALESTSVSAGEVHQLVRGYLLHYGYADSLAAFDEAAGMAQAEAGAGVHAHASVQEGAQDGAKEAGMDADQGMRQEIVQQQQSDQMQQGVTGVSSDTAVPATANGCNGPGGSQHARGTALLPLRSRLRQLLMTGDTAGAAQLLQEQAPGLLAAPGSIVADSGGAGSGRGSSSFELLFHLSCQQFIELIRSNDIVGALAYAEGTLSSLRGASPGHDALLRDVVALIAYQQPEQSPLAPLLSPAHREATADIVNVALLRWQAPPGSKEPQAALEVVLQQLTAVQHELHELAGGHGPMFDLQEHLPKQPSAQEEPEERQDEEKMPASQQQQPGGPWAEVAGAEAQGPVPMAE